MLIHNNKVNFFLSVILLNVLFLCFRVNMSRYSDSSDSSTDSYHERKSKKKKHRRSRSRSRDRRKDKKRSRSRSRDKRSSKSSRRRSRSRSRSRDRRRSRDQKRSSKQRQRSYSRSRSKSRSKSDVIVVEDSPTQSASNYSNQSEVMLTISDQLKRARAISDIEGESFQQQDFKSSRKGDTLQIPLPNDPESFQFGTSMEVKTKAEEDLDKLSKEGLINPKLFGDQAAREKRYLQHIWTIRQRALQKMKT